MLLLSELEKYIKDIGHTILCYGILVLHGKFRGSIRKIRHRMVNFKIVEVYYLK